MLSDNLRDLRRQHKLSQEEVAEAIGVSRQAVAKWENGDTTPDIINCMALAKLYSVTLDDLVNYQREKSNGFPVPPQGKYIFGTVTVGERGQIVIPAKARKIFDIHPGDDLLVLGDEDQGGLALMKADLMLNMLQQIREETGV